MGGGASLAGRTALLLRAPERAARTVEALAARGARTVLCPLIDFELPADTTELDAGVRRLVSGGYDWIVLTSITTIRALKQRAGQLGLELTVPAATRLAAVGGVSARAARTEGLRVDFVPADQSAAGLVAELSLTGGERVCLPQADIAAETLAAGLTERGANCDVVVAYRTVDAPAAPQRRLTAAVDVGQGTLPADAEVWEPARLAGDLDQIDAVLFTSPSIARAFASVAGTGFAGIAVAIGESTRAELEYLGFARIVTSAEPTPASMADAWESALRHGPEH
ncbi:uroporphyrinogen-III synthase [Zhihengliuella halotolerans]|uniref:uroporphyrinogen-III synthase n=1 Tax=Zhihengliuella halotolerans TaxID=370736 RepID=UPI000C7FFE05|nr:uroporphyrinogen-III synthase [Zhihengliuella halotolerans]